MQIIKRNGQVAEFDPDKIYQAILKAAQTVYVLDDTWRQNLAQVTKKVVLDLQDAQVERPTINMIQSLVENRLMEAGFINIAEHYIWYTNQAEAIHPESQSHSCQTTASGSHSGTVPPSAPGSIRSGTPVPSEASSFRLDG